jgi:hypothetical protein
MAYVARKVNPVAIYALLLAHTLLLSTPVVVLVAPQGFTFIPVLKPVLEVVIAPGHTSTLSHVLRQSIHNILC